MGSSETAAKSYSVTLHYHHFIVYLEHFHVGSKVVVADVVPYKENHGSAGLNEQVTPGIGWTM